jgi:CRISPR-associated protein Cmx8
MVWSTLRGRSTTRKPFEKRANGKTDDSAKKDFQQLVRNADQAVELPSTYYLGAQKKTAENVRFCDRTRFRLLLNFWPYCSTVYVLRTIDQDGKAKVGPGRYVLSIPDVADLDLFCSELPEVLRAREHDKHGYLPRGAVIDIAEESGLDALRQLTEHLAQKSGLQSTSDLLLGADVVHMRKEGHNVQVLGSARVEPDPTILSGYARLRSAYWDAGFRRHRILNLLRGQPWHFGFGRYLSTCPRAAAVDSRTFRHDSKLAFEGTEVDMHEEKEPAPLDELVYRVVGTYLARKLDSKHDLRWEEVKSDEANKLHYSRKKEKLAKTAFLAARARTGADFVEYFSATLFSVSHYLSETDYLTVSRSLLDEPETVRTLTMLALSARA